MSSFSSLPKKLHHHCPLCGQEFTDTELDIIESSNGKLMVYATCGNCGVGMIAKVSILPQGLVGLGILTDLSRDEVSEVNQGSPVSADEVLVMKILTDKGYLEIKV